MQMANQCMLRKFRQYTAAYAASQPEKPA